MAATSTSDVIVFSGRRFPLWDIDDRIRMAALVRRYLEEHIKNPLNSVCINDFGFYNLTKIFGNIKPLSSKYQKNIFSDNYVFHLLPKPNLYRSRHTPLIAMKMIPLSEKARVEMYNPKHVIWREVKVMQLVTDLVRRRMTPHLPMIYGTYICNSCEYRNPNIKNPDKVCVLMLNELSDMDLMNWIVAFSKQDIPTSYRERIWITIFFQIWAVLLYTQDALDMRHHDLHWGNILINICDDTLDSDYAIDGHYEYVINGLVYYVPNHRVLVKLWDFGKAFCSKHFVYNMDEIRTFGYSTLRARDMSVSGDVIVIHNVTTWIDKLAAIENKDVIPARIRRMLDHIRYNISMSPWNLIQSLMTGYLHNRIGTTAEPSETTVKIESVDDVKVGDLVVRPAGRLIGLVVDIVDFDYHIIYERKLIEVVKSTVNKFSTVHRLVKPLAQSTEGPNAYLNRCIFRSSIDRVVK